MNKVGVEYYDAMKSDRYLAFKNKLSALWIKPNVIKAINSSSKSPRTITHIDTFNYLQKKNRGKHLEKSLNAGKSTKDTAESDAKAFLENQEEELKKRTNLISNDLHDQRTKLFERIEARKMSRSVSKNRIREISPAFAGTETLPAFGGKRDSSKKQGIFLNNIADDPKPRDSMKKLFLKDRENSLKSKLSEIQAVLEKEKHDKLDSVSKKYKTQISTLETQIQSTKS